MESLPHELQSFICSLTSPLSALKRFRTHLSFALINRHQMSVYLFDNEGFLNQLVKELILYLYDNIEDKEISRQILFILRCTNKKFRKVTDKHIEKGDSFITALTNDPEYTNFCLTAYHIRSPTIKSSLALLTHDQILDIFTLWCRNCAINGDDFKININHLAPNTLCNKEEIFVYIKEETTNTEFLFPIENTNDTIDMTCLWPIWAKQGTARDQFFKISYPSSLYQNFFLYHSERENGDKKEWFHQILRSNTRKILNYDRESECYTELTKMKNLFIDNTTGNPTNFYNDSSDEGWSWDSYGSDYDY